MLQQNFLPQILGLTHTANEFSTTESLKGSRQTKKKFNAYSRRFCSCVPCHTSWRSATKLSATDLRCSSGRELVKRMLSRCETVSQRSEFPGSCDSPFLWAASLAFSFSASVWARFFSSSICLTFSAWARSKVLTKLSNVETTVHTKGKESELFRKSKGRLALIWRTGAPWFVNDRIC